MNLQNEEKQKQIAEQMKIHAPKPVRTETDKPKLPGEDDEFDHKVEEHKRGGDASRGRGRGGERGRGERGRGERGAYRGRGRGEAHERREHGESEEQTSDKVIEQPFVREEKPAFKAHKEDRAERGPRNPEKKRDGEKKGKKQEKKEEVKEEEPKEVVRHQDANIKENADWGAFSF